MERKREEYAINPSSKYGERWSLSSFYEIEEILSEDETQCHKKSKEEKIDPRESKIFRCESDTRDMLHSLFERCSDEKSAHPSEERNRPEWNHISKKSPHKQKDAKQSYMKQEYFSKKSSNIGRSFLYDDRRQSSEDQKYS